MSPGPWGGGLQPPCGPVPGFAAPHSRLCLVCLCFQSPLSLSERQLSALGPPSSGLTSAPETLFSNKVRFRCGRTQCPGRSPKCPALSANTSHLWGFPLPSLRSWLEPCLLPESRETTSLTVPRLLPSPRVFLCVKPLFRHPQTPHSDRSPCVSRTLAATRPVSEVGGGGRLSPQCHLNLTYTGA